MVRYTVDLLYYDAENNSLRGDMFFYFENTLNPDLWAKSANEMQESFISGFNSGCIGEDLDEPEIHNICKVAGDDGIVEDDAVISNIVLLPEQRKFENVISKALQSRYPNTTIHIWYKNN